MALHKRFVLVVTLALSLVTVQGVAVRAEEPALAANETPTLDTKELLKDSSESDKQPTPEALVRHRTKIEALTKRLAENPKDIEAMLERGRRYYEIGEIKLGNSDFESALKLAPEQPRVWHVLGQGLLYRQLNKEALVAFQKAIQLGSKDPRLFVEQGVARESLGELQQAIASYSQSIQLDPNYADAYIRRAVVLGDVDEWNRELADWSKAIELGKTEYWVYHNRGKAQHALGQHEHAIESYTLALKEEPNDAKSYYARAQLQDYLGNWKLAISDYDRAIKLQPQLSLYLSTRGVACIKHKEYEKGIQDLLEAIRLSPGDLGNNYKPSTNKQLSPAALKHGEEQIRKMLKDRPAMAEYVKEGDPIWIWVVRKFAGEDLNRLVDWNDQSSETALAMSSGSNDRGHGEIRVNSGGDGETQRSSSDLWSSAVFELHNLIEDQAFDGILERAMNGELTRDQFILGMLQLEERAIQRTRAFYLKHFLPHLLAQGIQVTSPRDWYCDQFLPKFKDINEQKAHWEPDYRWNYYGAWYDLKLARREFDSGNYDQAKKLLESILDSRVASDNEQYVRHLLGSVYLYTEEYDKAIEEFTTVLSRWPDDRDCLSMRGQAWSSLQNADNSLADHNKVVTLHPDWPLGYYYRAAEFMRQRNYDGALDDINKAVELDSQDPDYYCYRAEVWIEKADFDRAIEDYSRANKLAPEDALILHARASARLVKGEVEKALLDYDEVIGLEPRDGSAFRNRGIAYSTKKDYERAWNDFSTGIKLDPSSPLGYFLRAKLLLEGENPKFRRPKEALQDAQKSCELSNWQSPKELNLLAAAYAANNDFENAVRFQTKALYVSETSERESQLKLLESYRAQAKK